MSTSWNVLKSQSISESVSTKWEMLSVVLEKFPSTPSSQGSIPTLVLLIFSISLGPEAKDPKVQNIP